MGLKSVVFLYMVGSVCSAFTQLDRPCELKDYGCMTKYLTLRSPCNAKNIGTFSTEFRSPELQFATPFFNASYVDHNLVFRNADACYISEFAENKLSGTMVISVTCPYLDLESNRELIQHANKREDSYFYFHIRSVYPEITTTVNLLRGNDYNLCNARVSSYLKGLPKIKVDPLDKPTKNVLTRDLSQLYIYERELGYYRGIQFTKDFISRVLCDFGCEYQRIFNF